MDNGDDTDLCDQILFLRLLSFRLLIYSENCVSFDPMPVIISSQVFSPKLLEKFVTPKVPRDELKLYVTENPKIACRTEPSMKIVFGRLTR